MYSCSFERSCTDGGFRLQARLPERATLVPIARDGRWGVCLRTEPGDSNIAGSRNAERCDLMLSQELTDGYEGREHWWAHSIFFPDEYVAPPSGWGVAFDFHHTNLGPGQANFHVDAGPEGLRLRGYGGAALNAGRYEVRLGPVSRNTWYDFVYHVLWSPNEDGFMVAWVNGVRRLAHQGPTLYAGQGCYLKLANYHSAFGRPSAIIHDRVVRGATPEQVSLTPLGA